MKYCFEMDFDEMIKFIKGLMEFVGNTVRDTVDNIVNDDSVLDALLSNIDNDELKHAIINIIDIIRGDNDV
ncbi:MAG: hypothetical protein QXL94_03070 [Candidatus Parvarchaeum sp.]